MRELLKMLGTVLMPYIGSVPGSVPPPEVKLPTLSPWLEDVAAFPGAPPGLTDETPDLTFSSMPALDGF